MGGEGGGVTQKEKEISRTLTDERVLNFFSLESYVIAMGKT